jgi:NO-binding membrane sensor protein with MHYT domain
MHYAGMHAAIFTMDHRHGADMAASGVGQTVLAVLIARSRC